MGSLYHKLQEFKDSQSNCKIQCELLFELIEKYQREFNLPVTSYKYERRETFIKEDNISIEIKNNKNEDRFPKVKIKNINELVDEITEDELKLSNPANICCS